MPVVKPGPHVHDSPERDEAAEVRIGVVADPGLPASAAGRLADGELTGALQAGISRAVRWRLEVEQEDLPLDADGMIPVVELGRQRRDRSRWDVVVYITDLPRRSSTQPVLADISTSHAVGLISLPAVGWVRLRPHVRDTLVHVVRRLAEAQPNLLPDAPAAGEAEGAAAAARARVLPRRPTELISPVRETSSACHGIDLSLKLVGLRGRARLLFGMVRDNRPWRLVPHLKSATAAAAATGAFGIFYYTIWTMAEALPPWRLALIMALAIVVMAAWLLVYNHLWEPPAGHHTPAESVLYNVSTVVTLLIGVTCMYGLLYVVALGAAAVVIDASYMQSKLGHPASAADYATLVWLASSMGIVAGALGSSLDSEEAVREANYSRRERERQARRRERERQARRMR